MKKSIVLLITLALIVAISALIAVGLMKVDEGAKSVEKKHFLIQTLTFTQNAVDILGKKRGDINSSDGFEMLLLTPIELKSKEISLNLAFDSAAKGINPNNFLKKVQNKFTINPDYVLLFDRILQSENVQNKELFLAMIEDTLDKDLDERIPGSEIALYDKRFAQGSIENFKKFMQIIDHYVRLSEDGNIYKIPWREILSFHAKKIDFNYISPKLLHYMLPYLDSEGIKKVTTAKKINYTDWKDLPLAKEYKDTLKRYDISFFVPILEANMSVKQADRTGFAHFVYDINQKKVLDIAYKID